MKRLPLLLSAMLLALASCSATLRLHATAPTLDNDSASCTAVVLVPRLPTDPVTVHFSWTGPRSGEDSVVTVSGGAVSIALNVPAGTYTVHAWGSDAGGAGCDTMFTTRAKAAPWKVGP
jgi:homogentisate 1,2-dioxygenase